MAILPEIFFPAGGWLGVAVAGGLAAAGIVVFLARRVALPRASVVLGVAGIAMLCLAAGRPVWRHSGRVPVLVAVDLSASTRSANYRNRRILQDRMRQLLGGAAYRIVYFADGAGEVNGNDPMLPDIAAENTNFAPIAGMTAGPILLFSDGQFPLPAKTPPIYVAVDPGLEHPDDAAVKSLEVNGDQISVVVSNTGAPRSFALRGSTDETGFAAPRGEYQLDRRLRPGTQTVTAEFSPGDLWPENDGQSAAVPIAPIAAKWWVGNSPPPGPAGEWTAIRPADLPAGSEAYLSPAVIVLDDVPASALSAGQQNRLEQYVRDLGGSLVLLGGPSAFAAGGYAGTPLDAISSLASTPPAPTTHWMLLADSSGSMDEQVGGGKSAWQAATAALLGVLPHLPGKDLVSAGNFAETLNWWVAAKPVSDAKSMALPPPGVGPGGPTNLDAALRRIADEAGSGAANQMPRQLLLLTDADAAIDDPASLGDLLRRAGVHVHLLAIGNGSGLPALRRIAADTGGGVIAQFDPQKWADGVADLARSATPTWQESAPANVHFLIQMPGVSDRPVSPWNRTWIKPGASAIASAMIGGRQTVLAARWNLGSGQSAAVAFTTNAMEASAIADLIARRPRDPRFKVEWESGAQLRVTIDAEDIGDSAPRYLNRLSPRLELSRPQESVRQMPIEQTGPGLYSASLPCPRQSTLATVVLAGRVLDRIAVAGRYAPEFDAIGNNRDTMNTLARTTGGLVIEPSQTDPIDFHWPTAYVPIASELAIAAALCLVAALVGWRIA